MTVLCLRIYGSKWSSGRLVKKGKLNWKKKRIKKKRKWDFTVSCWCGMGSTCQADQVAQCRHWGMSGGIISMLRTTDRVQAFTELGGGKKMGCFPLVQVRCHQSSQIVYFFETAGDSPAHVFCSGTQGRDRRVLQRAVFSVHCSSLESRELVAIIRSKMQKE